MEARNFYLNLSFCITLPDGRLSHYSSRNAFLRHFVIFEYETIHASLCFNFPYLVKLKIVT